MIGFEPTLQGLEGPRAAVTPHSQLDRPTGIEPVPPRWRRGMLPPHPGRICGTGDVHRLSTSFSFQRARSSANALMGSKGFEPKRPQGEAVLQTAGGPSAPYCPFLATAPGFEPGPTRFGGSDAHRYTTLSLSIRSSLDAALLSDLARARPEWRGPKQKRPSRVLP